MLSIDSLVLETTRRCNMRCDHCLRGDPQNKQMSDEHMYNFLRQVEYISNVTFTGGEPTLPSGLKVIERFMEICNELGVDVGSFYIATNAKVYRPEIADILNRLYNFCTDNEISAIAISTDRYHYEDQNNFKWQLEEDLMYKYGIENILQEKGEIDPAYVISEGRGVNINWKQLDVDEIYLNEDEGYVQEGTFYLNCNGKVINGCDWSYESQDEREDILIGLASDNLEMSLKNYKFTFIDEYEEA